MISIIYVLLFIHFCIPFCVKAEERSVDIGKYLRTLEIPAGVDEVCEVHVVAKLGEGVVVLAQNERRHIYYDSKTKLWLQLSFDLSAKNTRPLFECLVSEMPLSDTRIVPLVNIDIPENIVSLIGKTRSDVAAIATFRSYNAALSRGPKITGEILMKDHISLYVDRGKIVALATHNLP